jgi:hypothetical protein
MQDEAAARCARARRWIARAAIAAISAGVTPAWAAAGEGPSVFGIPVDFVLFAITLLCVGIFHHHTLAVALTGLVVVSAYKLAFTGFNTDDGLAGLGAPRTLGSVVNEDWVFATHTG